MSNEINKRRRRFMAKAAVTVGTMNLLLNGRANAQSSDATRNTGGTAAGTPINTIRHIDAGVRSIGYAEVGRAGGPFVILLHGGPYDIHSFADVAARLESTIHVYFTSNGARRHGGYAEATMTSVTGQSAVPIPTMSGARKQDASIGAMHSPLEPSSRFDVCSASVFVHGN
ncbi:hydrolase [Caballeronia calidae]|uniref:Hydrolase n=1 Tax=Caballeronia calidae TaxID=1777139 RepID=A0A158E9K1_9BURK|nr:hypothetical protein [Caballeronia calidae]SAL03571.1 hydrolase [Caballeronia calidae]